MASIVYLDQCADLVGTVAETFAITSGSNDALTITVDGGSPQSITLTAGATRTAAQVASDINATLTGATAYATPSTCPQPSRVRIRTTSVLGASSTILIGSPSHNAAATLGFTAGGTTTGYARANVTWTATSGTKQELANEMETVLLSVGWTTISGSTTNNLLMQSALSPPGEDLQMRVRIRGNGTNCVCISVENVAGTVAGANATPNGGFLLPAAAKVWRLIANKYQAFIHIPPPYSFNASGSSRGAAAFGIPTIPSFLQGVVTEAIWMSSTSKSDADGSNNTFSLHNALGHDNQSAFAQFTGNYQTICNGTLVDFVSGNVANQIGAIALMALAPGVVGNAANPRGWRWHDSSANIGTPAIGWGLTTSTVEAMWRGVLWDAMVSSESYTGDSSISFDTHTFLAITDANVGSTGSTAQVRGTLFVAVA